MSMIDIVLGFVSVLIIFFIGSFVLGTFLKVRDAVMQFDTGNSQVKLYTPLIEVFKSSLKGDNASSVNSKVTRNLVLFSWVVSSFLSLFFLPIGSYSFFPNVYGQFQLVAIFGLLMVYPIGMMILNSLSSRKMEVLNLKYLSEDFFSNFITFLFIIVSLMITYTGGFNFTSIPTIDEIICYQSTNLFHVLGVTFPSVFGIVNPFAFIAFFAIMPSIFRPFKSGSPGLLKKWDPVKENYVGKSLSAVKVVEIVRFTVLIVLFIDLFIAGGNITMLTYMDILVLFVSIFTMAVLLAFVKSRRSRWILDKKLGGFLKVHNLLAVAALIYSAILVM
ncbi:MAG: hypothetical protein ACTSUE_05755 [Promethearchaeota archaeon]